MTGKERLGLVLSHKDADKIAIDFGATAVSGIHCKVVEALRRHYGLDSHPVYVHEPLQMLAIIEDDLAGAMGVDTIGCFGRCNMFNIPNVDWKEYRMPWGQVVMLPAAMADCMEIRDGSLYCWAEADKHYGPSGVMPESCYFFNSIERQQGEIDDSALDVEDNLEECGELSESDVQYWKETVERAAATGRAVIASFGGMALGDIALVVGMGLKQPRGIRSVAEWYMSTIIRQDYIHELFERQSDIAVRNLQKLHAAVGDKVDVVNICGTDFGTQIGQFCSEETFRELYLPYYRKMNDWIHANTSWKTFKHSCGAVFPLIDAIADAGFDILNPVQIAADGMNPTSLKERFGKRVTFWGGGVNTQTTLPFGTPEDVRREVLELCDIFGRDGGFVFNTVHNIQANVPIENVVSMMETLKEM